MKFFLFIALIFTCLASCSHPQQPATKIQTEDEKLETLIRDYTEQAKRLDAYDAPYFNVTENLDKFGDYPSVDYFARSKALYVTTARRLRELKPERLSKAQLLAYRLFSDDVKTSVQESEFPVGVLDLSQISNRLRSFIDQSNQTLSDFPFKSVENYEAFAKRAQGFPAYVDRQIEVLNRGIKQKIVLSCAIASQVPLSYKSALEPEVEKNPFYRPILHMPAEFTTETRDRLEQMYRETIEVSLIPAYAKFDTYFRKTYAPNCRQSYGMGSLPNGKKWYRHFIQARTDLNLEPKEIHAIGLREVERIAAEMAKVQKQLGEKGSLKDFLKRLSTDEKWYFRSRDEMFAAFAKAKGEVNRKIPDYFSLTPKSDYQLAESTNPEDAAASYLEPTDTTPHGRFVVNTTHLRSVPRFGVMTLSLHEAVPGHHFQIALQVEMKDRLSEYQRKLYSSNAFVEGWALYAEYLGNEMGLLQDPLQRLGHLNDEMLRAVRLVVDTGIHEFGWTQKKTIDFMSRYLASDAKGILNEANRYSVWPAQALSYKLGQLKIIELRRKAEGALGPRFSLKDFHRVVIGQGTISLAVLESEVNEWIAQKQSTR